MEFLYKRLTVPLPFYLLTTLLTNAIGLRSVDADRSCRQPDTGSPVGLPVTICRRMDLFRAYGGREMNRRVS